jgi:hypothetical protein
MNAELAAPTARRYCYIFWSDFKPKFNYRDRLMSVVGGISSALVTKYFGVSTWPIAIVAGIVGALVVLILDSICKTVSLLWFSYKKLQDVLAEMEELKLQSRHRQEIDVKEQIDHANFLLRNASLSETAFWRDLRIQWVDKTANRLASHLKISQESAMAQLTEGIEIELHSPVDYLKRDTANLRRMTSSSFSCDTPDLIRPSS